MSKYLSVAAAAGVGGVLGAGVSFVVNCALAEISVNPFFAFYFGALFCLIAGLILMRLKNSEHPRPGLLLCFALTVLLSGVLCILLEQDWFLKGHPLYRVPLYSILGVAVTFSLCFTVVDLTNHAAAACCANRGGRPLVESELQVMLVIVSSMLMGVVFGFIFGYEDVEDAARRRDHLVFMRTESICYPIGAVIGAASAVANHYLGEKAEEHRFDPLRDTEFDDEEDY